MEEAHLVSTKVGIMVNGELLKEGSATEILSIDPSHLTIDILLPSFKEIIENELLPKLKKFEMINSGNIDEALHLLSFPVERISPEFHPHKLGYSYFKAFSTTGIPTSLFIDQVLKID